MIWPYINAIGVCRIDVEGRITFFYVLIAFPKKFTFQYNRRGFYGWHRNSIALHQRDPRQCQLINIPTTLCTKNAYDFTIKSCLRNNDRKFGILFQQTMGKASFTDKYCKYLFFPFSA